MFKRLVFLLSIAMVAQSADFEAGRRAFENNDYPTALREWMPFAEKGNFEAQRKIGWLYESGNGVIRSEAVALNWYRKAALQGDPKALAALGWICPHGQERAGLILSAEGPLLRLAQAGDAEAQSMVGQIWNQKYGLQSDAQGIPRDFSGNPQREVQTKAAEAMWRRAAAQGNYDAHLILAGRCAVGMSEQCEVDVKWLTSAAVRGDRDAQLLLGQAFMSGRGVAQNYQAAVKWVRKAAEQGDHGYERMLGDLYLEGKNIPRDYAEAIVWYRKAAGATYSDWMGVSDGVQSAEKLAAIFSQDTGALRNDAEAVKWYVRAAEWGSVKSQRHLGYYFKSADWFRRAAAQGDAASQCELGRMLFSGIGVLQDYMKAHLYLNLAASRESHIPRDGARDDFEANGGMAEAAKQRDAVARLMTADQVAEAQTQARRWTLTLEPETSFKLDGPCLVGTVR